MNFATRFYVDIEEQYVVQYLTHVRIWRILVRSKMKIADWRVAEGFARKYAQARPRLRNWRKHVHDAIWKEPIDVMKTFNNASHIPSKGVWVFNIGSDRLIAVVDFALELVLIRQLMTHNEYMKWSNKK